MREFLSRLEHKSKPVHYHIANMMMHIIAYNHQCLITDMKYIRAGSF